MVDQHVCERVLRVRPLSGDTTVPGFPIRKSADQRLLAPPHSLSQHATSFIASCRQGIHQMLFSRHLLEEILNLRSTRLALTTKHASSNKNSRCDPPKWTTSPSRSETNACGRASGSQSRKTDVSRPQRCPFSQGPKAPCEPTSFFITTLSLCD